MVVKFLHRTEEVSFRVSNTWYMRQVQELVLKIYVGYPANLPTCSTLYEVFERLMLVLQTLDVLTDLITSSLKICRVIWR